MKNIALGARDILFLEALLQGEPIAKAKRVYSLGAQGGYNAERETELVLQLRQKIKEAADGNS